MLSSKAKASKAKAVDTFAHEIPEYKNLFKVVLTWRKAVTVQTVEEVKLWRPFGMVPTRSYCQQEQQDRETHPEVMFCIVKEEPDLPVAVGQEDLLQGDHVWMFQFSQQLEDTRRQNAVILSRRCETSDLHCAHTGTHTHTHGGLLFKGSGSSSSFSPSHSGPRMQHIHC